VKARHLLGRRRFHQLDDFLRRQPHFIEITANPRIICGARIVARYMSRDVSFSDNPRVFGDHAPILLPVARLKIFHMLGDILLRDENLVKSDAHAGTDRSALAGREKKRAGRGAKCVFHRGAGVIDNRPIAIPGSGRAWRRRGARLPRVFRKSLCAGDNDVEPLRTRQPAYLDRRRDIAPARADENRRPLRAEAQEQLTELAGRAPVKHALEGNPLDATR
jgi:hypothetical protein